MQKTCSPETIYNEILRAIPDAKRYVLWNFKCLVEYSCSLTGSSKWENDFKSYLVSKDGLDSQSALSSAQENLALFILYKLSSKLGNDVENYKEIRDFECDCCKEVTEFYKKIHNWLTDFICEPLPKTPAKYHLRHPNKDIIFKGDTMTSVFTPLKEYIKLKSGIQSTSSKTEDWGEYWLNNIYTINLSENAGDFIRWGYSFSNFLPVPQGFNTGRSNFGKWDSWDLILNQIYQWYLDNSPNNSLTKTNDHALEKLFKNKDTIFHCAEWLKGFSSWENFIKQNYMQSFLSPDGQPKKFFENHTLDYGLPKTLDEYEEFFETASTCIRKRGAVINYHLEMNDIIRLP